jgi:microcystin-dependent protein
MTYTINYTDNINKTPIVVNDSTTNVQTSLQFPGRNQRGYGISIAENFLHLLENFARDNDAPGSKTGEGTPVAGQLWFDSAPGVKSLKIYDGQIWKSVGVGKNTVKPTVGNIKGDLVVDTTKQQLYLWNGTSWVLVGPGVANGIDAGTIPEIIKDIYGNEKIVVKSFVQNPTSGKADIISIISSETFTPSPPIDGFGDVYPGLNLRKTSNNKFWGTSEKAENLIDGTGTAIPTSSFLRIDLRNTVSQDFIIKNDNGLSIGADSTGQLKLQMINNTAVISHSTSAIEFKINNSAASALQTIIRLDPTTFNVGINTSNPTKQLDVKGTGGFTGKLEVTNTVDVDANAPLTTSSNDQAALSVWGGVAVKKKIHVGDDAIINGQIYLNYPSGAAIVPALDVNSQPVLDIGSSTKAFRNIYATNIYGSVTGAITGDVSGNASTANSLRSSITIELDGDVSSNGVSFYGTEGTITLTTTLSPTYINNQHETTIGKDSDLLLVYREGQLYKTAKSNFTSSLSTVPVGTIITFAGSVAPDGYLFCDGSEKPIGIYKKLFDVIGYLYGDSTRLVGFNTFKLPDLRGRFALGRIGMDNNLPDGTQDTVTVLDQNGRQTTQSAGGGTPTDLTNRVSTSSIATIGAVGGNETQTITQGNLPMNSIDSAVGTGINREAYDSTKVVTPVSIVNPYLTINYLIYAGA